MNNLLQNSKLFMKKNTSTILTCIGGAGVVVTSVLSVKATPKAMALLEYAKEEKGEDLTKMEIVKTAGPAYIPAIVTGVSTIACIFGANILNQRQQAALMSAYALLDSSYTEFKDKVKELYGEEGYEHVKEEIAKDKYEKSDISQDDNMQLYYDEYSGRMFNATSEQILRAENKINQKLSQFSGAYLNEFYEAVGAKGLEPTDYGNYMGWSSNEIYEFVGHTWFDFYHRKVVMDDGLEVIIISFMQDPTFDFENYY